MSEQQGHFPKISRRPYEPGDEGMIVDLLNLSYPHGWGTIETWRWRYADYPTFERDNVFIFEADGKIVGHGGLFLRDFLIPSIGKVRTATPGDAAVHPDFRGFGIYSPLQKARLEAAKCKTACLVFGWAGKGSITHKYSKKTGFAEVRRGACYCKILNHERVFKSEVRKFIMGNDEIRSLIEGLESNLCFGMGGSLSSVAEILGEEPDLAEPKKKVKIIFDNSAFPLMLKFRLGGKLHKATSLFLLLLSRRMKIRFTSFGLLLKLVWKGIRIIV